MIGQLGAGGGIALLRDGEAVAVGIGIDSTRAAYTESWASPVAGENIEGRGVASGLEIIEDEARRMSVQRPPFDQIVRIGHQVEMGMDRVIAPAETRSKASFIAAASARSPPLISNRSVWRRSQASSRS